MRLLKYIMTAKNLTKAEAIRLFVDKRVSVNDRIQDPSCPLNNGDKVYIDDIEVLPIENKYFLYYKPKGILSMIGSSPLHFNNAINLGYKLMPCGRLDKESRGLMILSNDAVFINDIMNKDLEKTYILKLKDVITSEFLERLSNLKEMDNKPLKPFKFHKIDSLTLSLSICEGRYHQCRKMALLCGNKVIDLLRVKIGDYSLLDMKPGELREIKRG
ncbi:MAG: hypothetical protein K6G48_02810 [Acholeplasmatales bacterium]|nr:hypothetical protein [Acholeplasmatales bacterium]